jgi:hypothetical protein
MARPIKENAEYFTHDNDMRNDERIKAVRRKFKLEGYAIYNMLLEKLCDSAGFKIEYSDLSIELLAGDFEVETDTLKQVIDYLVYLKLILVEEGLITSRTLLKRFDALIAKRKRQKEWLSTPKTPETKVMDVDNTQSRVEYNREEKSREEKSRVEKSREEYINKDAVPNGTSPEKVSDTTVIVEKEKKEKSSGEKEKTVHYLVIDAYNQFIIEKTGVPANITAADGKGAKDIISFLRRASNDKSDEGVLNSWKYILQNWNRLEPFLADRLKLIQIQADITNIINQIKNGKQKNGSSKATTPSFDALDNFIYNQLVG